MELKIPELKKPSQLYDFYLNSLESITKKLRKGHEQNNIQDGPGIFLNLSDKFLEIGRSCQLIIQKGIDSISCYSLLRMQADYLSTLYLIFTAPTKDEIRFRYFLYFLDGFTSRKDTLDYDFDNDQRCLTQEEFSSLKKQVELAIKNSEDGILDCMNALENHPYKTLNSGLFDKIVKNRQWRYKTFSPDITKYEYYKWEEMYSTFLDKRKSVSSFISYLSNYIHGASVAIIVNKEDFNEDPILCCGINLLSNYRELLESLYGKDIIDDLFEEESCKFLLENISRK